MGADVAAPAPVPALGQAPLTAAAPQPVQPDGAGAFPEPGARGGGQRGAAAQLPADHGRVRQPPVVVADSAPAPSVQHLHAPRALPGTPGQAHRERVWGGEQTSGSGAAGTHREPPGTCWDPCMYWDMLGGSGTYWDHGVLQDLLGPTGTPVCSGTYWDVLGPFCALEPSGTCWDSLHTPKPTGTYWDPLAPCVLWEMLGTPRLTETYWDPVGSTGTCWEPFHTPGHTGTHWDLLKPTGTYWELV